MNGSNAVSVRTPDVLGYRARTCLIEEFAGRWTGHHKATMTKSAKGRDHVVRKEGLSWTETGRVRGDGI